MAGLIHLPGVAGCDEAGRGPLAGPVVCASVVLPQDFDIRGINDSKSLTSRQREDMEGRIKSSADWAIEVVSADTIDKINVLEASLLGMQISLERLAKIPRLALIDGNKLPKDPICRCEVQVKGDAAYACIAAASILAKCARDRIMIELHNQFPVYGFDSHFGYPTPQHLQALSEFGPCPEHRKSFGPVKNLILQPSLDFETTNKDESLLFSQGDGEYQKSR